jgi:hypothetical protein
MIAFLLALGILFQSQQPPKITASVVTKEGVPSTPDSIGETDERSRSQTHLRQEGRKGVPHCRRPRISKCGTLDSRRLATDH